MERSEIESEASQAVKNLRSRFEQLASSSSTSSSTSSPSNSVSHSRSESFMKDTAVKVPYTANLSPSTSYLGGSLRTTSSSETLSGDSKAAALKRPPPPPPPRNPNLQVKRSLSPLPGVHGFPSPLARQTSLPQSENGDSPSVIISPVQTRAKPPVPPRPPQRIQCATPDPSPPPSDEDTSEPPSQRPSRLSALPPPPRHNSLSPHLPASDGLPTLTSPPPPPLPVRRGATVLLDTSSAKISPPPSRTNTIRPPPSPRIETRPPLSPRLDAGNGLIPATHSPDLASPIGSVPHMERRLLSSSFPLPPPTRTVAPGATVTPIRPGATSSAESSDEEEEPEPGPQKELLPDSSDSSRRPPELSFRPGAPSPRLSFHPHSGSVVAAGSYAVTAHSGHIKVYNLETSDSQPIHNVELKSFGLRDTKISCMEFRSCVNRADRGYLVWMGTKEGGILEFDIRKGTVVAMRPSAHLHCITHIFRHARSMVTLDDSGKALIFSSDTEDDINLKETVPRVVRTTDKQDFVKLLNGKLWTAGKTDSHHHGNRSIPVVRVYDIFNPSAPARSLLPSEYVGRLTSATILPSRPNCVYVGHEEGFVSIWALDTDDGWPACYEVTRVSTSDIMSLEGVDARLWAGGRGGTISAYDVGTTPWKVTNNWVAHPGLPVLKMFVNHLAIERRGVMCVVSLGRDENVRFWDGLLGQGWVENELIKNEPSFSSFQDISLLLLTYNLSACRPDDLNRPAHPQNAIFFNEVFASVAEPPDILAFSFQEVVDLEKRRVMTKSVLLNATSQRKQDALSERVTGNYKRWHDKLVQVVRTAYAPLGIEYEVVHVESLVGLFSCVFVKKTDRFRVRDVMITSIKRGLGGRYGNKGAIVCRLVVDDSSICFVNCHLAAGQQSIRRRNADVTTFIEDKTLFKPSSDEVAYVGGGDGTMILDHEFVLWNGDMNYRIDLRREAALAAIRNGDFAFLRQHDQLLREMRNNRGFRLRGFQEGQLNFAPTYKYDPYSNDYDSSEKRRVPAWCDRILWRSRTSACSLPSPITASPVDPTTAGGGINGRVKQLHYRRYDNVNISDHRPVSAAFRLTVKKVDVEERKRSKRIVEVAWQDEVQRRLAGLVEFYIRQSLL